MLDAAWELEAVRSWAEVPASMGLGHFVAPTKQGFWRVEILRVNDENSGPTFDAFARTWISGDDIYDPFIDKQVSRLRTLGVESHEAKAALRELTDIYDQKSID